MMAKTFSLIALICIYSGLLRGQEKKFLQFSGNSIILSNGTIELDQNGFPKQLQIAKIKEGGENEYTNLLVENIHFHFTRKVDGKNISFKSTEMVFVSKTKKKAHWRLESSSDSINMVVDGFINKQGSLNYRVRVIALGDIRFKDVSMHIPMGKTLANNISGLGLAYAPRPDKVEWNESISSTPEVWLGTEIGGLQYALGVRNFIKAGKLHSAKHSHTLAYWTNDHKGGMLIGIKGSSMLANNFTGEHQMKKGDIRYYDFALTITPGTARTLE